MTNLPLLAVICCLSILFSYPLCCSSSSLALQSDYSDIQLNALVQLYNSTNGPNWDYKRNWLKNDSFCTWYGVTCRGAEVVGLNLGSNSLKGPFPSFLNQLSSLEELKLSSNKLYGSIPWSLGQLPSLKELNIANNELSGEIPYSMGELTSLRWLSLGQNNLSGTIPPSLGNITSLWELHLGYNALSGTIPSSLQNLASLRGLGIPRNNLSGTLPSWVGRLQLLGDLFCDNNQFTSIPMDFMEPPALTSCGLQQNPLICPIPTWARVKCAAICVNVPSAPSPDLPIAPSNPPVMDQPIVTKNPTSAARVNYELILTISVAVMAAVILVLLVVVIILARKTRRSSYEPIQDM